MPIHLLSRSESNSLWRGPSCALQAMGVALAVLTAVGVGAALYGGLTQTWDLEVTLSITGGSLLTLIASIGICLARLLPWMEEAPSQENQESPELSEADLHFFQEVFPGMKRLPPATGRSLKNKRLDMRTEGVPQKYEEKCTGFLARQYREPVIHHYAEQNFSNTGLLVRLPRNFLTRFPRSIQEKLGQVSDVELYFVVHLPLTSGKGTQHANRHQFELHRLVYPDVPKEENHRCQIEAGVFNARGIESGFSNRDPEAIGLESWKPLTIHLHDQRHISPDTGHFRLIEPIASYYLGAKINEQQGCAVMGICLCRQSDEAAAMIGILRRTITLHGLLDALSKDETLKDKPATTEIQRFFA